MVNERSCRRNALLWIAFVLWHPSTVSGYNLGVLPSAKPKVLEASQLASRPLLSRLLVRPVSASSAPDGVILASAVASRSTTTTTASSRQSTHKIGASRRRRTSLTRLASSLVAEAPSVVAAVAKTLPSRTHTLLHNVRHCGSSLRERLERMGVFPLLVYSIISQINTGTTMSIAWYLFSAKTGLSPLAPGQWRKYLALYAPFLVLNNVLRPLRLAAAVAWSRHLERLTVSVQERLQWHDPKQKTQAIVLATAAVYAAAMCYSASCFLLASAFSGVPLFPATPM